MKTFKMECGCYYSNFGFKVGNKYLYIFRIDIAKKWKIPLDEDLIKELREIREKYQVDDAMRMAAILDLNFHEDLNLHNIYEVE